MTIAASTVLSGFNSLTLTPALCALFLQANKEPKFFVFKAFNKVYDKTQGMYDKIVGYLLNVPFVTMVLMGFDGILLCCHYALADYFHTGRRRRIFYRCCATSTCSQPERTQAVGDKIDKILDSYPEIKTYIGVNGFSIMGGGEQSNSGNLFCGPEKLG